MTQEWLAGHHARKRFGQNFLHDRHWIERIVRAIDPQPGDALVEIGPGQAALTREVIQLTGYETAIEIDRDLATFLREQFPEEKLSLIEADALTLDWNAVLEGRRLRIIGNLPYNISSPLLFKLLEAADRVIDQHFMLQREVVDRMVAVPGSKTFGRLSVMLQYRYQMYKLFDVPPGAFTPAPKVVSSIVRRTPFSLWVNLNQVTPTLSTGEASHDAFSSQGQAALFLSKSTLNGWGAQGAPIHGQVHSEQPLAQKT